MYLLVCDDSMYCCPVLICYNTSESNDVEDYLEIPIGSEVIVAFAETTQSG